MGTATSFSIKDALGNAKNLFGWLKGNGEVISATVLTDSSGNEVTPLTAAQLAANTANIQTTISLSSAATSTSAIALAGYYGAGFLLSGLWTGTLVAQVSYDNGGSWINAQVYNPATKTIANAIVGAGNGATNGSYNIVILGGATHVRLYSTAYSGSNAIGGFLTATIVHGLLSTLDAAAESRSTYSAIIGITTGLTLVATATDFATIFGSATKVVKLVDVQIGGSATTATEVDFFLIKRTTANTGGTSAPITPTVHDSADSAPTATVLQYTANPTVGAGTILSKRKVLLPASASLAPDVTESLLPSYEKSGYDKPLVLRSTTEGIALNFNGAAVPTGALVYAVIVWTEE